MRRLHFALFAVLISLGSAPAHGVTLGSVSGSVRDSGGVPLEKAARLCVYLASEISDGITGKLISAQWDPWENLHKFREQLARSDVYTLRRIVPEDRGLGW